VSGTRIGTHEIPRKLGALALLLVLGAGGAAGRAAQSERTPEHQPVVRRLIELLAARPDLESALVTALARAGLDGLATPADFFAYCDALVTWIPIQSELSPRARRYHFVIGQAPDDRLNLDPEFSAWMGDLARAMGEFLDTPASAAGIASFTSKPAYRVGDYDEGPSGWLTFNQFFARALKPGKRPVAAPCDDRVIVSPADSIFMGQWPIAADSKITVKGVEWSIAELLAGSPYAGAFGNGTYAHSFLSLADYHRYHLPVGGVVREVRHVDGRYRLDIVRDEAGELQVETGDTFQFHQARGLVVVESPVVGLVAILPVGMSMISSIALTPEIGAELAKGEEFGYFQFGGSDIVLLFQDRNERLEAKAGRKYLQGERIGVVE